MTTVSAYPRSRVSAYLLNGVLLAFGALVPSTESAAQGASPIEWLQKEMTCDQLSAEMKDRYASLGAFSKLTEEKKQEVGLVLDIICGARFAHCSFKNCQKLAPVGGAEAAPPKEKEPPKPVEKVALDPVALEKEAALMLAKKIDENIAAMQKQIQDQVAKEKSGNLNWTRIRVPEETALVQQEVPEPEEKKEVKPVTPPPAAQKSSMNLIPQKSMADKLARPRPNPGFEASLPSTPQIDVRPQSGRPKEYTRTSAYLHEPWKSPSFSAAPKDQKFNPL